jgi:thioester reductase-like protein
MVPAALMQLEVFPLTINGKVDVRALPLPDVRPDLDSTFIAPQTPMEQQIAEIWTAILGIKEVGTQDDFFALGGNSLLAAQLIAYIRETFEIELPVRLLFEYPTIEALAQTLEAAQRDGVDSLAALKRPLNLSADAVLDAAIRPPVGATPPPNQPRHAFLTGATGFLGAFLIQELLQSTPATVYCLVRCRDRAEGAKRLQQTMMQYGIWDELQRDRIVPVPGDLSQPRLGLSQGQFDDLANQIDTIYHSGALVNFVKPYSLLKAANVHGTEEILKLACQGQSKVLHYISTDSVFGTTGYFNRPEMLRETDDITPSEDILFLGYSQSKWVAEKLVQTALSRGLSGTIFRPGLVLGHSQTGATNLKDYPSRLIKGCIQLGGYPDLSAKHEYFVPADYASRAIVHLSLRPQSLGQIFHIVNPKPMEFLMFMQWITDYGYPLQRMPYLEWQQRLIQQTRYSQENALYPLVPMQVEKMYKGLTLPELYQHHPYLDCQNTLDGLAGSGIVCPEIGGDLLRMYFDYFIRNGYLTAPA